MRQIIDIVDLDCIYLSYDEPKKEQFWIQIQNMVPWAKRVKNIKGSDAAHKAVAKLSETDRFILIDGDNIPDKEFFNQQLILDDTNCNNVFRWKARNEINGLMYGNGGISCWTKEFILGMRTHEASDGADENNVEFCFHPNYWAMNDCYSVTYPNQSPFQAWRAGFREGVKMCLDRGAKPSLQEFEKRIYKRNYDHLGIWHNIGMDADNGVWAIYGARVGTKLTMLTDWNYKHVQNFDIIEQLWKDEYSKLSPGAMINELGAELKTRLGLNTELFGVDHSKFFKYHYKSNFQNKGIMVRE